MACDIDTYSAPWVQHIFASEEGVGDTRTPDEHVSRMRGIEGLTIVETATTECGVDARRAA